MEYKIEKGVPIPEAHKKQLQFPFMGMKVLGISFCVPLAERDRIASLSTAASYFGNKNGVKFTTRTDRARWGEAVLEN